MSELAAKKDAKALEAFGKGFVKVPRQIMKLFFSEKATDRLLGKMYFSLICLCNFADGHVFLNGEKVFCAAGEYVCTHRVLSAKTHIQLGSISRLLHSLSDLNLIEVTVIEGGSRIRVCGYAQYGLGQEFSRTKGKGNSVSSTFSSYSDYHGIDPNIPFT